MGIARLFYQSILWKCLFFLSAFILNIFIARHFQAIVSGQIYYLINLYTLFILIAGFTMESAMGFFVANNKIDTTKIINFSLLWTLGAGLIMFIFVFIHHHEGILLSDLLPISYISGNILANYCAGIAAAKKNFWLPSLLNIIINFLLIFLFLFVDFFKVMTISDSLFITIFFGSFLLQGLIMTITLKNLYAKKINFILPTFEELKMLLRFSVIAFCANIISFLLYKIDYWFVKEYCSGNDLGNYIQVSKIAQVFFILPAIIAGTIFPLTAGGHRKQINDILTLASRTILIVYFFCCVVLAIAGKWLFPFLFGNSFTEMYIPFLLLTPGILALSTLYLLTAYYAGKNRIIVNIKGAFIALIFLIPADVLLIPKYGINAAALISSIAYIIYNLYVLRVFIREYNVRMIDFFTFKLSDFKNIKNSFLIK